MKTPDAALVFKLLAGLGALALLAIFAAPFFFLKVIEQQVPAPSIPPATVLNGELGELGSTCGGTALLPCLPGLTCSADPNVKDSEGVCVKEAQRAEPSFRASGETCGGADGFCGVGLYCKKSGPSSACAVIDPSAPSAVSIKITGASLANGVYFLPIGTKGDIVVQTANAANVAMNLEPNEGYGTAGVSLWLSRPVRGKGGVYTSTLTLAHDFEGNVTVVVTSASGDTQVAAVNVASSK